jgi:hypothetical protein
MRTTKPIRFRTWAALLAGFCATALLVAGPPPGSPKFYPDDPLWREVRTQDASRANFYEPQLIYDLVENMFAQPGDKDFNRRAQNVNTVDEVPDGDWFTNRAGLRPLTPQEVARGANTGGGPPPGRWTVVKAKTDGVTPGFTVKGESGQIWYIKPDPPGWRGMATGTEVVVAKLFWALGYHTTEYYIAKLRPADLVIDPAAKFTPPSGKTRTMRHSDIKQLLKQAEQDADGSYRVIASLSTETLSTPGEVIGRIRFYGTRPDDPNDLVPHENRRELRGYGVFSAWFNHVDAKSINSIEMKMTENGRSFIRHYLLDFGSTLGSAAIGPRDYWEGYEYLLEPYGQIAKGMVGFGFYILPWRTIDYYESRSIGRIPRDNTKWDPEWWRPRVANPAFIRARLDDKFWAARKAMAISDEMIRAAVAEGKFNDPPSEKFLAQALIERRDAIGKRYLPAVNPIVDPALNSPGVLTFGNAAVQTRFAMPPDSYKAVWFNFDNATGQTTRIGETTGRDERMQAPPQLPAVEGAFVKVELSAASAKYPTWAQPVSAYFRRQAGGWKLVGFERLP